MTIPGLLTVQGKEPRPYQIIDAAYLNMWPRSVLAEYAGTGKKLIAIMAMLKLFARIKARNCLVISLGSDVDQWMEEFDEFTEGLQVQRYRGTPKDRANMRRHEPDVRCCSYQTAVSDMEHLKGMHDIIILDEVSYIKNFDTAAHAGIHDLCRTGSYVWGLTATPMETGPMEIWSLFHTVLGRASPLGANPNRFKLMFCTTKEYRIKVPKWEVKGGRRVKKMKRIKIEKVTGANKVNLPEMKRLIDNYYMRHPWDTVKQSLPELTVIPKLLDMGKKQRDRYKEISSGAVIADFVFQEMGKRITSKQVGYAIKQFYQLRCCDGLNSLPGQKYRDSVKMNWCMEQVTGELGNQKLVWFSRYHQPLDDAEHWLNEYDIPWARIDGNQSEDDITEARKSFNSDKGALVLLITEKARYALNLQVADNGIAYNRIFNPQKLNQLHGRTRRGNPDEHKIWFHPICKDTCEEYQWNVLREREELFADIFGLDDQVFDLLDTDQQRLVVEYGLGSSNR